MRSRSLIPRSTWCARCCAICAVPRVRSAARRSSPHAAPPLPATCLLAAVILGTGSVSLQLLRARRHRRDLSRLQRALDHVQLLSRAPRTASATRCDAPHAQGTHAPLAAALLPAALCSLCGRRVRGAAREPPAEPVRDVARNLQRRADSLPPHPARLPPRVHSSGRLQPCVNRCGSGDLANEVYRTRDDGEMMTTWL